MRKEKLDHTLDFIFDTTFHQVNTNFHKYFLIQCYCKWSLCTSFWIFLHFFLIKLNVHVVIQYLILSVIVFSQTYTHDPFTYGYVMLKSKLCEYYVYTCPNCLGFNIHVCSHIKLHPAKHLWVVSVLNKKSFMLSIFLVNKYMNLI